MEPFFSSNYRTYRKTTIHVTKFLNTHHYSGFVFKPRFAPHPARDVLPSKTPLKWSNLVLDCQDIVLIRVEKPIIDLDLNIEPYVISKDVSYYFFSEISIELQSFFIRL